LRLLVDRARLAASETRAVPYRVDLRGGGRDAVLARLVELGALDVDLSHDGAILALIPDNILPEQISRTLGAVDISVSPAVGRDAESVWILSPRPVDAGRLRIVPAHISAEVGALALIDAPAFGTGLHPTTGLCLEALDQALQTDSPDSVLDVGTGSGVIALGALWLGVPRAMGIDIDDAALRVAANNARINGLLERLQLTRGGPAALSGTWPLVFANILAAPLIEMAPLLVRRVGHRGVLVLSGIACSVEHDVSEAYRDLGMRLVEVRRRAGWVAFVLRASW
jgi:ribosomal protein L11 methyltransferase